MVPAAQYKSLISGTQTRPEDDGDLSNIVSPFDLVRSFKIQMEKSCVLALFESE